MIKTQYSRYINKRTETAGVVPTIGPSDDHTDGTWGENDIYPGEMYINMADQRVFFGYASGTTSGVVSIFPPQGPSGIEDVFLTNSGGITLVGSTPNYTIGSSISNGTQNLLGGGIISTQISAGATSWNILVPGFSTAGYSQWVKVNGSAQDIVTRDTAIFESRMICTETSTNFMTNVSSYSKNNFGGAWSSINITDIFLDCSVGGGDVSLSATISAAITNTISLTFSLQYYRINN